MRQQTAVRSDSEEEDGVRKTARRRAQEHKEGRCCGQEEANDRESAQASSHCIGQEGSIRREKKAALQMKHWERFTTYPFAMRPST
jgi:hypothetical protein